MWTGVIPLSVAAILSISCCRGSGSHEVVFLGYKVRLERWVLLQQEVIDWSRNGKWVLNVTRKISNNIIMYAPCPIRYGTKNQCSWTLDGDQLRYYWSTWSSPTVVEENKLVPFSAQGLCSIIPDTSILVIGDSVSMHASISWINQFYLSLNQTCFKPMRLESPRQFAYFLRGGCRGVSLIAQRNDYVSLVKESTGLNSKTHQHPWAHMLSSMSGKDAGVNRGSKWLLVVLNRGAHFVNDSILIKEVNDTLHFVTSNYPFVSIIWRNTPHGERNWEKHAMSVPLTDEPLLDSNAPWFYGHFKRQNEIIRRLIHDHYRQILYLDVFRLTVLRADSHYDALHLCIPGIMDTWLQLIYNALLLIRQAARETEVRPI